MLAVFVFSLFSTSALAAENNSNKYMAYQLETKDFKFWIELENLSRPTFVNVGANKIPFFQINDNVNYKVEILYKTDLLNDINVWFAKKYPGAEFNSATFRLNYKITNNTREIYSDLFEKVQGKKFGHTVSSESTFYLNEKQSIELASLSYGIEIEYVDANGYELKKTTYLNTYTNVVDWLQPPIKLFSFTEKMGQTITYPNISSMNLAHKYLNLNTHITSSAGTQVRLTSLAPKTCRITGLTVIFIKAGDCNLMVTSDGSEIYNPATERVLAFTIAPSKDVPLICTKTSQITQLKKSAKKCPSGWLPLLK